MNKVIGIGEYELSNEESDKLKTYALASCVAVTAYNPIKKVGGMVHVALPSPLGFSNNRKPCYYATTGIPIMINKLCSNFGCLKGELEICIYGGADSINEDDIFLIGKRNIEAVAKSLIDLNLTAKQVEVGGLHSRTIELDMATGIIKVYYQPINI